MKSQDRRHSALPRIRRSNLVDDVARAVREAIVHGHLQPGAHLVQDELARELGVSRTPLREALGMLHQEGLLVVSGGRGLEVRAFGAAETVALYEVREVVDGLAARLACQRATADDWSALRRACDGMASSLANLDNHTWLLWNLGFHEALLHAAGNAVLNRELPLVQMSARAFFPTVVLKPERAQKAYHDHLDVLAALEAGDAIQAEAVARRHIAMARQIVIESLE